MMTPYLQQIALPEIGVEGQRKLLASSVLVVGMGGLGCAALPYLAASGIPRIGLIDFDRIEVDNLARQILFAPSDIGRWKVDVAAERLLTLCPKIECEKKVCKLTVQNAQELLLPYDIIIDATDNLQARLAINTGCSCLQKPWVYGSIHQWEGQVALFLPGNPDYRSLFPEGSSPYSAPTCTSSGVLGPFAGIIGAIQALEAIKWLAGIQENLGGKLLLINGKSWRSTLVALSTPEPTCEIPYAQLLTWMAHQSIQLIDARRPEEKQNGDLGGAHFLPDTFNKSQKVVVYCQSGRRSLSLAHQLRKEGFEAYSLQGGINAIDL